MATKTKLEADSATGSLFEENYLVRTLGRIAQDPEVALSDHNSKSSATESSLLHKGGQQDPYMLRSGEH